MQVDTTGSEGSWSHGLETASGYPALFDLAKGLVQDHLGRSRVGIMLGLQGLGLSPTGYLGGYYVVGSNAIVLNRDVLHHIQANHAGYLNAYAFHVILHEYLHALGYLEENTVRRHAHTMSVDAFGRDHPATRIAAAMAPGVHDPEAPAIFGKLTMPPFGWQPDQAGTIEYVKGIDPDASPYIM